MCPMHAARACWRLAGTAGKGCGVITPHEALEHMHSGLAQPCTTAREDQCTTCSSQRHNNSRRKAQLDTVTCSQPGVTQLKEGAALTSWEPEPDVAVGHQHTLTTGCVVPHCVKPKTQTLTAGGYVCKILPCVCGIKLRLLQLLLLAAQECCQPVLNIRIKPAVTQQLKRLLCDLTRAVVGKPGCIAADTCQAAVCATRPVAPGERVGKRAASDF